MQKTMQTVIPLLALVIGSMGWFGFRKQGAPPDLSTPKATVRSFVAALVAKDADAVAACVQGAQAGSDLKALLHLDVGPIALVTGAEVKNVVAEAEGDSATVAVEVTLQAPSTQDRNGAKVTLSVVEMFHVRRQNEQWRIVPDEKAANQLADPTVVGTRYDLRPLATMAALVGGSSDALHVFNKAREEAIAVTCISNARQIALGVLMYVQDYDEMYPRKKAPYKDLIFPYVKNNQIFQCPVDAKGTISYVLNPNLQGVSIASVVAPAQTVLLYEGSNMQFAFKHNGRTVVAFADGHVKMLTPEATRNLFWYSSGKKNLPAKSVSPRFKPATKKTTRSGRR